MYKSRANHFDTEIKIEPEKEELEIRNFSTNVIEVKKINSKTVGKKGKEAIKCNICHVKFFHKYAVKKHIASVHEGKNPFKCSSCKYQTVKKANLNAHIASVHEGKKPFKCSICEYPTALKSQLNAHTIDFQINVPGTFVNFLYFFVGVRSY